MAPHREHNPAYGEGTGALPWANNDKHPEPIAIVGFSLCFPQEATTSEGLWDIMLNKRNTATPFPSNRISNSAIYHPDANRRGQIPVQQSHFVRQDLACFDASFFATSTTDAATMDPQQRLLLEYTYLALENAGIPMEKVSGSKTSVFTGTFSTDWMHLAFKDGEQCSTTTALGIQPNFNANRVSWFFNLIGNSANIDTACSSSLVCLDMGCQSLLSGNEDMSIVAGSNVILSPDNFHALTNLNMLSPDGQCYSFDHRANGYGRGEGVGVVILKRISDALRDHDTIRGIIRSTGCNQDGHTPSITLPNHVSQERLIRETYQKAGLSMEPTRFFEAHGTGTQVGDPTESRAVGSAFRQCRTVDDPLWIGAIKSNIGHLEGASGIAGVIKTLLVLEKGVIPPNTNFEKVNPKIDTEFLRIKFPLESVPWPSKGLRRASVNSFGNAGTNAHAILDDVYHFLEEHGLVAPHMTVAHPPSRDHTKRKHTSDTNSTQDASKIDTNMSLGRPRLLVFSANDAAGIKRLAKKYSVHHRQLLENESLCPQYIDNLAYTLGCRRSSLNWKAYAVIRAPCELTNLEELVSPAVRSVPRANLALAFTGQGAQWPCMAEGLSSYRVFRQSLSRSEAFLKDLGCSWTLHEAMSGQVAFKVPQAELSQSACTAVQIALVDLLNDFGVQPAAVVGHSSGEIAAAYCVGGISHASAIRLAYYRGLLAGSVACSKTFRGAMMAVGLSQEETEIRLNRFAASTRHSDLAVACVNSPGNVTISGDATSIDAFHQVLQSDRIFAKKLHVDVAYHSKHMQSIQAAYASKLRSLEKGVQPKRSVAMFSSVTGQRIPESELLSPRYWVSNLVSRVNFLDALTSLFAGSAKKIRKKLDLSHRNLLQIDMVMEVGPHSALQLPVKETLSTLRKTSDIKYTSLLIRHNPAHLTMLDAIGQLHALGHPVNIEKLNNPTLEPMHYVSLPTLPEYPFDHSKQYWDETRLSKRYRTAEQGKLDLLGKPVLDWNPKEPRWRHFLRVTEMPWMEHHVINGTNIYPGAGMLVMAIEAANQLTRSEQDVTGFEVKEVSFMKPLKIPKDGAAVETQLTIQLARDESNPLKVWAQWRLFACEDHVWIECCCGMIRAQYRHDVNAINANRVEVERVTALRHLRDNVASTCTIPLDVPKLYENFKESGLGVSGPFQRIISGSINNLSQAKLTIMPYQWPSDEFPQPHVIHPVTLDCMLHASFAGYTDGGAKQMSTMIPTSLGRLFVNKSGLGDTSTGCLQETASMSAATRSRGVQMDLFALDASGQHILMQVEGLRLTEIAEKKQQTSNDELITDQFSYHIVHKPDPDLVEYQDLISSCLRTSKYQQFALDLYLDLLSHKHAGLKILIVDTDQDHLTLPVLQSLCFEPSATPSTSKRLESICIAGSLVVLDAVKGVLGECASISYRPANSEPCGLALDAPTNSYDIIIASKMSHQRASILSQFRNCLKPSGKLFLRERIPPNGEAKRPAAEKPEANPFPECGFVYTGIAFEDPRDHRSILQRFTVYTTDPSTPEVNTCPTVCFVLDSGSLLQVETANRLSDFFRLQGIRDIIISSFEAVATNFSQLNAVYIMLLEIDNPLLYSLKSHEFALLHDLFLQAHSIIWVTGAGGSNTGKPEYQLIHGLARALRSEHPELQLTTISLQLTQTISAIQMNNILKVLEINHFQATSGAEDFEFLEIDGVLNIARVSPAVDLTENLKSKFNGRITNDRAIRDCPPLELKVGSPGLLDTLHFEEEDTSNQPLLADEVEIQVAAIGVNFKDCLIALGQLGNSALGSECAGTVVRAGATTGLNIGDRVCSASTKVFKTVARCNANAVFKIPDDLSFTTAAAIPTQFGTAWVVIKKLARLQKGETILIHVGASGTGQAAIQIAQMIGATIYTTVGSQEKKTLLMNEYGISEEHIFYSRDTSFADGVRMATGGRGVDIIINSLAGNALLASWECIAPHGRFIELGKKDIISNTKLPMLMFEKMASFQAFDGVTWFSGKGAEARSDLQELITMFADGTLRTAQPLLVKDIGEVGDVFKAIQSGNVPGKNVLEIKPSSHVRALLFPKSNTRFHPDATYVIAGGLGGIGRATTRFFVERGARNLVLLSRYGPRSDQAHQLIQELATQGVVVQTPACDITDFNQIQETCRALSKSMPPIKGCVQASMVARDCIFKDMSFEDWHAGVDCKVTGSWNLHSLLPKGMDFFIMLSSASGLAGIKGQTNYDAANTYEDALARYRVSLGEKAVTFDLGAMVEDGILAETPGLLDRVLAYGSLEPITRQKYYGLLDYFCNPSLPLLSPIESQVAVGLSIGGGQGLENYDHTRQPMLRPLERIQIRKASGTNQDEPDIGQSIASSQSLDAAAQIVAQTVIKKLAKSLSSMQEGSVDMDKPLQMHGVDSLLAIELRNWIVKEFDTDLAVFETQGASTLNTLSLLVARRTNFAHPEWSGARS